MRELFHFLYFMFGAGDNPQYSGKISRK